MKWRGASLATWTPASQRRLCFWWSLFLQQLLVFKQIKSRASNFSLTLVLKLDFQIYCHTKRFYTCVCKRNTYKVCTLQRMHRLPYYTNISFFYSWYQLLIFPLWNFLMAYANTYVFHSTICIFCLEVHCSDTVDRLLHLPLIFSITVFLNFSHQSDKTYIPYF
jgi:hypothetical protein